MGLTTAACLADRNINVTGIDVDTKKLKTASAGRAPFYEPGLDERLKRALKRKTLSFSNEIRTAALSDITMITVGTPNNEDGSANLSYLVKAAEDIGSILKNKKRFHVVVVKSTVPPGTALEVVAPIIEKVSKKRMSQEFGICSNPEFLREGEAVGDTLNPDKVVIGAADSRTRKAMHSLYDKFYLTKNVKFVETNPQTAELIKYANNSFLATKISFINTIANICQRIPGTDVEKISYAIGLDERIGPLFLKAGLGYGGSCFPKDVTAMINIAEQKGYSPELLKNTHSTNQLQPYKAVDMLKSALPDLTGKTIAVLGLAFKPNTSDMREAVSIKIIEELVRLGAQVKAHDPMAIEEAQKTLSVPVAYCGSIKECLAGADACIIVTEWRQFAELRPAMLQKYMRRTILVDGRRVTQPSKFVGKIDSYYAIGYNNTSSKP